MAIAPWFGSERYGSAPFRNCGGSSGFNATMIATDNEANLNAKGRPRGKQGRTAVIKRGWRAFANQKPADSNGWPDQGDVRLMHQAMFPALPLPTLHDGTSADEVWDAIGPNAVSLAIWTGAVGSRDPIRRYVGPVAHQVVAWKRMTVTGKRRVKLIDPMHPASDTYTGHWVSWDSLRKCAKAVPLTLGGKPGGRFIYNLYPAGKWTAAKLATEQKRKALRAMRSQLEQMTERRDRIREERNAAQRLAEEQAGRIAELQRQLEDCGSVDCDQLVANARAAAHESAHVRSIEWHEKQRTVGP